MKIDEYSNKLNKIYTDRGGKIPLELDGVWNVIINDKRTGKKLAETGSNGLSGILTVLTVQFTDTQIWNK